MRKESADAVKRSVCIISADLFLVPSSRGTADALWNLALTLTKAPLPVHLVLVATTHELCLQSINSVVVHARELEVRISASCRRPTGRAPAGGAHRGVWPLS